MGCQRAGFYSIDALDNGGRRSAREIHPELQGLAVGDVIPATPDGAGGFEVLDLEAPRALVLGGLFDRALGRQLPFGGARPERFWHVTWAFALQPLDGRSTRVTVRVRGAFAASERWRARWVPAAHHIMEAAQLRQLAARAEGRLPRDDWRDVADGVRGAMRMAWAFLTPFLRGRARSVGARSCVCRPLAARRRVRRHAAMELDARRRDRCPAGRRCGRGWRRSARTAAGSTAISGSRTWPGAASGMPSGSTPNGRCGPAAGSCCIRQSRRCRLPPSTAAASSSPTRRIPAEALAAGAPWVAASWLFLVEPLDRGRSRFVSRYRVACSDNLRTRLAFGPALVEPIGAEMDRRMLLGVKARAERRPPMDAARR